MDSAIINLWTIGLPIPISLALIALLGYFVARRNREAELDDEQTRHELKRARAVVRTLERIGKDLHRHLTSNQRKIYHFKQRIRELRQRQPHGPAWQELSEEAQRMIQPTLQLAAQVAHAYDEIRQQANLLMTFTEVRTDPLTGLCNRRALDETLAKMFAMLNRYQNMFSVAMFDIDYFKNINDQEGHLYGDHILQEVARMFGRCARETDTIARFGGEEFLVLMPETDLHGAAVFAERLRTTVAKHLNVTVSGGITAALDGDTPKSLLARADAALYEAKSAGRNMNYRHTGEQIELVGGTGVELQSSGLTFQGA